MTNEFAGISDKVARDMATSDSEVHSDPSQPVLSAMERRFHFFRAVIVL